MRHLELYKMLSKIQFGDFFREYADKGLAHNIVELVNEY